LNENRSSLGYLGSVDYKDLENKGQDKARGEKHWNAGLNTLIRNNKKC